MIHQASRKRFTWLVLAHHLHSCVVNCAAIILLVVSLSMVITYNQ